jgi:hypothetical protein
MGQSLDAVIAYGYGKCVAKYWEIRPSWKQAAERYENEYYDKFEKLEEELGVELIHVGWHGNLYILAIADSIWADAAPKAFNPGKLQVGESWDAALAVFATELQLDVSKQRPRWWLAPRLW